jgi:palmitoyltransferase
MGNLPGDEAPIDIMQVARIGDIPAMEKLFETGDYDATYTDDEGITPLHVCRPLTPFPLSSIPQG